MIIDASAHGLHGKHLDLLFNAGGEWAKREIADLMRTKPQLFDISLRLKWLEQANVDYQVISIHHGLDSNLLPGDATAQLAMAKAINDNMAYLRDDSKEKFIPVASVPLSGFEKGGQKEMERAIKTLGLRAVSFPSNFHGKPLDHPEFEPFWAQTAQMGVPVYIHPNDAVGHADRSYESEYLLMQSLGWPFETMLALSRLVFSGIMERYPHLKIVSHHLGGGIPFLWGRISETYRPEQQLKRIGRVLPKPLFDYFSLFYYDTAIGSNASAIKCACELFGAGQILFGTDTPWGPNEGDFRLMEYPKVIKSVGLSEEDNMRIFADNALKILNLV
jgi:predicted TIM-barrel fold metal-dependent hydrolase